MAKTKIKQRILNISTVKRLLQSKSKSKSKSKTLSKIHSNNPTKLQIKFFYILTALIFLLIVVNVAMAQGYFIPVISEGVQINNNTIFLDSLTLEQKIGQMIIVHGSTYNINQWQKMNIGGFHLFAMESAEIYKTTIDSFQQNSQIPFFVTTDLEGCQNSFANFQEFTPNDQITTIEQATNKGSEEAKFLKDLGFSINFAPVVDLEDTIWGCRSFPGHEEDVTKLANAYVSALQTGGVSATIKHYPGKTLQISDPHQNLVSATIDSKDLAPYNSLIMNEDDSLVDLIMVSHIIVEGELNSLAVPSSVSPEIILPLKENYSGIIISDDILMRGLQDYYEEEIDQLYIDLVIAGHDLIINFNDDPNEIYHMIEVITEGVNTGIIDQSQIDASVTKILELKGFVVE